MGEINDISHCNKYCHFSKGYNATSSANTTYYWNYENAPNEAIYWIDDWDNEKIDFIPPEPVREGFIFKGWYKDERCTEKWDFENDVVPAKKYDESTTIMIIYM